MKSLLRNDMKKTIGKGGISSRQHGVGLLLISVLLWQRTSVEAFIPEMRNRVTVGGHRGTFTSPSDNSENTIRPTQTKDNLKKKLMQSSKKKKKRGSPAHEAHQGDYRRINQKIVQCETADELLLVLQTSNSCLMKAAGGGVLNSVNFSTALHRFARHCTGQPRVRAAVLSDPRFALFMACLGEMIAISAGDLVHGPVDFQSRELSNIGWALAKLKLPPPIDVMPVHSQSIIQIRDYAASTRQIVVDLAIQRKQGQNNSGLAPWIPAISQLSGHILDHIGQLAVEGISNSKDMDKPFQMQEYANLLWAWATVGRSVSRTVSVVIEQMIKQQRIVESGVDDDSLRPQEWSNTIWAIATSGLQIQFHLFEYVSHLVQKTPGFADRFKPQEWSNTVWGIATIVATNYKIVQAEADITASRVEPMTRKQEMAAVSIVRSAAKYITTRDVSDFKTQELSNTLWAMATIGFGLFGTTNDSNNNYVFLTSDQPKQDAELLASSLKQILRAALPLLPKFRSQELNNLAWALARLVDLDKIDEECQSILNAVLIGIAKQLANEKRTVTSQDIGTSLWALATLEFVQDKETLYRGVAGRLDPTLAHTYKPQELSNTLWALATAEIIISDDRDAFDTSLVPDRPSVNDPATVCFAIAARELMRRPEHFKSQEIKDVLWSYSKVGIRHPALFKAVTLHLLDGDGTDGHGRGLDEFSPQGLGNMAWAFARQAQLAAGVSERLKDESNLANSNGRLAVYTTSYIDVGETLIQRLFATIAETDLRVHNNLSNCKPQDLANTIWAFAVLGLKHVPFMEAVESELVTRTTRFIKKEVTSMTQFKGQELANILWALATLNMPSGNSLNVITPYIRAACVGSKDLTAAAIAGVFKRQELANMAWACAVFAHYPTDLMQILYRGLVGSGKECDPYYMSKVHGDQGLQSQAIMTLIYVQVALGLAKSNSALSLPEQFPDGWSQLLPSHDNDLTTETSFDELNLSTSKMQKSVSNALTRIGFDHVEEHVITMAEMATEHSINVAPKPIEILSIDVANIPEKVAIEVDGPAHFICRVYKDPHRPGGYAKFLNGKLEYQFSWNGDQQEINGPTALKQRLLHDLGWKVIHLPFWEWYELGGNAEAEEGYCRSLLRRYDVSHFR